eukprot:3305507-Amphidinium_carterae.1
MDHMAVSRSMGILVLPSKQIDMILFQVALQSSFWKSNGTTNSRQSLCQGEGALQCAEVGPELTFALQSTHPMSASAHL